MTEILSLPLPPFDYISVGPYTTTVEWPNELFTIIHETLESALQMFWGPPGDVMGSPGAPFRRVVFDVRGVTIIGCLDGVQTDKPIVCTNEVFRLQEELGCDPIPLLEVEMNVRWMYEAQK